MKILFIHQNFPAQFKYLAPALAARGHEITVISMRTPSEVVNPSIRWYVYQPERASTPSIHPWVADFETKVIRSEACFHVMSKLCKQGYIPDLVVAHPGWGESLFVKEVWKDTKLYLYCEMFYRSSASDIDFDPEFMNDDIRNACRIKLKNTHNILNFEIADAGISPTFWQADTFPDSFRRRITVIHDGIATDTLQPRDNSTLDVVTLDGIRLNLSRGDKVVTFVSRNLEPYRGYHHFTRALPRILKSNPDVKVVLIGGSEVSYGPRSKDGKSWKDIFRDEIAGKLSKNEWARVHYLGNVSYEQFVRTLQISRVHVYLTYPFVLSWSVLEAMSIGCAVVASDTAPVREVVMDEQNGCLVNFFDSGALAEKVTEILRDEVKQRRLGSCARKLVQERYDLKTVCLPRQIEWIERSAIT